MKGNCMFVEKKKQDEEKLRRVVMFKPYVSDQAIKKGCKDTQ